ncbi:MAG: sulfatase [Planctomycetota bacterium]
MRCVMVMYDSLNRHALSPYGDEAWSWVKTPNFDRLAKRAATFDTSYVCSMPCMPCRRDLHTGRPNFLHRSWGPIEPFDDSMPEMLKRAGVHTALISDHQHYWEDGGCTYHNRYSTWQHHRGQEGDPWIGQVAPEPAHPMAHSRNAGMPDNLANPGIDYQDRINRKFMRSLADLPQTRTFNAGLDFIERNADADRWMLQLETFDPHEPFHTTREFKDLYAEHHDRWASIDGRHMDWPEYRKVYPDEKPEVVRHLRTQYAALVSMCDARLGDVLDAFDRHGLWDDTMLVVWTDHGFTLGEQDWWAKMNMPWWDVLAKTPFFVHDPRYPEAAGQRRSSLVQPAIDLAPTLLHFFGLETTPDMLGRDLELTIADDTPVREAGPFGGHGGHVNVTDGRHVYMRAAADPAANRPLSDFTLMPTRMKHLIDPAELQHNRVTWHQPFDFTKGCGVMRIPADDGHGATRHHAAQANYGTLLYDTHTDPAQESPINDATIESRMTNHLVTLMAECDAPAEQYERLGLAQPA